MVRNALLAMLFFSLITFEGSDASFVWQLRKLVASDPKDNKTATHDSPLASPTPVSGDKKPPPDAKPAGETKKNKADPPSTNPTPTQKVDPEGSDKTASLAPPPSPVAKTVDEKGHGKEFSNKIPETASSPPPVAKSGDGKNREEEAKKNKINETCDGLKKCTDLGNMVACILKTDSNSVYVLLQNIGDSTIKVKLVEKDRGDIVVAKNQTEKINIPLISGGSTHLTLNAGNGDCVLHMAPVVHKGDFILRLPSYQKILTPVNGAYFLILTVLVFGGTWACCKFRKKRHDQVPYQELEMALPESVAATDVETAEGWDQGWDDDWDEDVAVKSPIHHGGSISANGLTSRSSNKDGWENNWDD